jgi:hypothetical protein
MYREVALLTGAVEGLALRSIGFRASVGDYFGSLYTNPIRDAKGMSLSSLPAAKLATRI